jgi:hypothetical protein
MICRLALRIERLVYKNSCLEIIRITSAVPHHFKQVKRIVAAMFIHLTLKKFLRLK